MNIRVTPKTREKLETLRDESGLAYGVLIDMAIAELHEPEISLTPKSEE